MAHPGDRRAIAGEIAADPVLRTFLEAIQPVRSQVREIHLFGSRARGDARPDSDYDLLLVVDRRTRALKDVLYDGVMRALLEHGRLISLKIFPAEEFRRLAALRTPFMENVRLEGVRLG